MDLFSETNNNQKHEEIAKKYAHHIRRRLSPKFTQTI